MLTFSFLPLGYWSEQPAGTHPARVSPSSRDFADILSLYPTADLSRSSISFSYALDDERSVAEPTDFAGSTTFSLTFWLDGGSASLPFYPIYDAVNEANETFVFKGSFAGLQVRDTSGALLRDFSSLAELESEFDAVNFSSVNLSGVIRDLRLPNRPPEASPDTLSTFQNMPLTVSAGVLLDNDHDDDAGDTLRITAVSNATGGTVSFSSSEVLFTPNEDLTGDASFDYSITDGKASAKTTVTVTVYPVAGIDRPGTNGRDPITGGLGRDTLNGGNGDDSINGGAGGDTLNGDNGDDLLDGGSGGDILNGGNGGDFLYGGSGEDTLNGGRGNDTLIGGLGNNTVTGGNGSDVFVLAVGDGSDTFTDFKARTDVIGLSGGLTFEQLTLIGDTIQYGDDLLATLIDVDTTTLTASNFISYTV